jgi:hypothetical protein
MLLSCEALELSMVQPQVSAIGGRTQYL